MGGIKGFFSELLHDIIYFGTIDVLVKYWAFWLVAILAIVLLVGLVWPRR